MPQIAPEAVIGNIKRELERIDADFDAAAAGIKRAHPGFGTALEDTLANELRAAHNAVIVGRLRKILKEQS